MRSRVVVTVVLTVVLTRGGGGGAEQTAANLNYGSAAGTRSEMKA